MGALDIALLGWMAIAVFMLLLWLVQLRTGNAGIVDFGWAAAVGGMAVFSAVAGAGEPGRRVMIGIMGGAWGSRLALHLLVDRVIGRQGCLE